MLPARSGSRKLCLGFQQEQCKPAGVLMEFLLGKAKEQTLTAPHKGGSKPISPFQSFNTQDKQRKTKSKFKQRLEAVL